MTTLSPHTGSRHPHAADVERAAVLLADNPGDFLVQQLPLVRALVRRVGRRHRLTSQDTDDLASNVLLHLVQNDFYVLRQFRGSSSFRAYLSAVITRRCLDYRDEQWGKWRASAAAQRRGPVAVGLERATSRDGMSVESACATLAGAGVRLTHDEACAILQQMPRRTPRRSVGEEQLESVPAATPPPDTELWSQSARMVSSMLQSALTRLGATEQQLLKLRFRDRISVADLARQCGVDQKALYRRFDGVLERLRTDLERQGVRAYR